MQSGPEVETVSVAESWGRKWQYLMDKLSPHSLYRWLFFIVVFSLYCTRVYYVNGWYIVTYGLGIFMLNQFIGFLSPQVLLENMLIDVFNLIGAAVRSWGSWQWSEPSHERVRRVQVVNVHRIYFHFLFIFFACRPFARRLPEFKFWYSCTRAVIIAFFMTFFEIFDVPVFWPILLLYFIVLFFITMKRQIKHMIKYKYLPFSFGKQKYQGKEKHSDKWPLRWWEWCSTTLISLWRIDRWKG